MLLLYTIGAIALGQSTYGPGVGAIGLTHIGCIGTEGNVSQCNNNIGLSTCTHAEDASVVCKGERFDVFYFLIYLSSLDLFLQPFYLFFSCFFIHISPQPHFLFT